MKISREYLENEIISLQQQEAQFLAAANSANGAIQAYKSLLEKFTDEEILTETKFAELVAGKNAKVEGIDEIHSS